MISALTFSDPNFSFDELEPTKHSLTYCKDYIARYFVPLSCGNIAVFKDGKYSVSDDTTVRKVYLIVCLNLITKQRTEQNHHLTFPSGSFLFTLESGLSHLKSTKKFFTTIKSTSAPA